MNRLANEPLIRSVGVLGIAQMVVAILGILGVITADQAVAIGAVLTGAGTPVAVARARSQAYGPVTFERATRPDTHPEIPAEYHGQG